MHLLSAAFANHNIFGIVATLSFFSLFVLVVWYLVSDRRRGHEQHMQRLPLEDDTNG